MLQHWFIVKTVKFLFKPLKDAVEWQQKVILAIDKKFEASLGDKK